ncbi:MAG: hypothetical protein HUU54_01265 [Ignavibacteriaceae bacterium]|nr:hypothetical protein [Ignavibacteriaceae bacterium]
MGNKRVIFLILIICYAVLGFIAVQSNKTHIDEEGSHIPTAKSMYHQNIIDVIKGVEYKSASTPLPYLITALVHRIIKIEPNLKSVRMQNLLISLVTIILFILLIKNTRSESFIFALILFFYPYFLKPSFTYHMSIYGLIFFFLFLLTIRGEGLSNRFLAGLSLSMAVLSQQFYLVLFAVPLMKIVWAIGRNDVKREIAGSLLILALSITPVLFLLILWGGLTHPAYRNWGVEFRFENMSAVLTVMGIVSLPVVLASVKQISRKYLITIIPVSIIIAIFFFPEWVSIPKAGGMTGMSFNALEKLSGSNEIIGVMTKSFFIFTGLVAIYVISLNNYKQNPLLLACFIMMLIAFVINKIPSERHLLPMVSMAILLLSPVVSRNQAQYIWLPYQILIGGIYFVYLFLF